MGTEMGGGSFPLRSVEVLEGLQLEAHMERDEDRIARRIRDLVRKDRELYHYLADFVDDYEQARRERYSGSAFVNIVHFEEVESHPHEGMLMFVYRYDEETESYSLECHMEINYRTVQDQEDRLTFQADEMEEKDTRAFVDRKIDQFTELYEDPPSLMS